MRRKVCKTKLRTKSEKSRVVTNSSSSWGLSWTSCQRKTQFRALWCRKWRGKRILLSKPVRKSSPLSGMSLSRPNLRRATTKRISNRAKRSTPPSKSNLKRHSRNRLVKAKLENLQCRNRYLRGRLSHESPTNRLSRGEKSLSQSEPPGRLTCKLWVRIEKKSHKFKTKSRKSKLKGLRLWLVQANLQQFRSHSLMFSSNSH